MGNAAGHVGPGACPLRRFQIGDVIEGHHIALGFGHRPFTGQLHLIDAAVGFIAQLDLVTHLTPPRRSRLFQRGPDFGHDLVHGFTHELDFRAPEHLAGAGIDQGHGPIGIETDNARRHPLHHGFGELAALLIDLIGLEQVLSLGLELLRHAIEAVGEVAQIAPALLHRHLDVEIARTDPPGGDHQVADRIHEAVGKRDADPQGGEQQHHGKTDIHDGEGDLEHQAIGRVFAVFGDVLVREPHILEHFGVDRPRHEEVGVIVAAQLDDRADKLRRAGGNGRGNAFHHSIGHPVRQFGK